MLEYYVCAVHYCLCCLIVRIILYLSELPLYFLQHTADVVNFGRILVRVSENVDKGLHQNIALLQNAFHQAITAVHRVPVALVWTFKTYSTAAFQ